MNLAAGSAFGFFVIKIVSRFNFVVVSETAEGESSTLGVSQPAVISYN